MNKSLLLLCLFLIQSCTTEIYPSQYYNLEALCKQNGGVERIVATSTNWNFTIFCNNGARFRKIGLKPDKLYESETRIHKQNE